jgi:hypothetical protein
VARGRHAQEVIDKNVSVTTTTEAFSIQSSASRYTSLPPRYRNGSSIRTTDTTCDACLRGMATGYKTRRVFAQPPPSQPEDLLPHLEHLRFNKHAAHKSCIRLCLSRSSRLTDGRDGSEHRRPRHPRCQYVPSLTVPPYVLILKFELLVVVQACANRPTGIECSYCPCCAIDGGSTTDVIIGCTYPPPLPPL